MRATRKSTRAEACYKSLVSITSGIRNYDVSMIQDWFSEQPKGQNTQMCKDIQRIE
jgi:hypothetical protein